MMNTKLAIKVAAVWTAIVYAVCFLIVALLPGAREWYFKYALHTDSATGVDVLTLTTFVSGLIFWVVLAILGAWLFATLVNKFKRV